VDQSALRVVLMVRVDSMRHMWLFTRHGFYSVVQDKANDRHVQVRARIKDDLEGLTRFVHKAMGAELSAIISTPNADYSYRIVVEKVLWVKIAATLASDIDYTNFKDEIHGEEDRDVTYLKVWSAMNELQRKRKRSQGNSS